MDMESQIRDLEGRVSTVETEQERQAEHLRILQDNMARIDRDLSEIKGTLSTVATKADLHREISGILGGALNSVPAWFGVAASLVTGGAVVVGLVLQLVRHG